MSERRGREFWAGLSAEVDAGESCEEVARRHRVKITTLRWWRWRLGTEQKARTRRRAPALVPVVVKELLPAPTGDVELLVGGVVVRFAVGTDVDYVTRLVGKLGRAC